MIITQSKGYTDHLFSLIPALVLGGHLGALADALYGRESWYSPYLWVAFLLLFVCCFAIQTVAWHRTFILNETGCTVCFLWYKRQYRWDELEMKQYVTYGEAITRFGAHSIAVRGVEFSPKRRKISRRRDGCNYSLRHPLTFIPISFLKNGMSLEECDKERMRYCYPMDEELFRSKMKEWHVEPEETERGIWVPKSDAY